MNTDIQLSANFKLSEFTESATAKKLGIVNLPNEEEVARLKLLCIYILEPVRKHFDRPVKISSGFRCEKLNSATPGSSSTSQHRKGQAADIKIKGVANVDIFNFIRNTLIFDQLIAEYMIAKQPEAGWVHVSYVGDEKRCRMDVKSAVRVNGKVTYPQGLHLA